MATFDPMSDSRRNRYLSEYNNPKTTAARKKAIDAKWGFSKNSAAGTPQSQSLKGFLSDVPGAASKNFKDIGDAEGALGGQQGINQYNAYLNATLNRPREEDPFGTLSYSYDPKTGEVVRKMESSPTQAGINRSIETLDEKNLGGAIYKRDQASETMRDPYSLNGLRQRENFNLNGLMSIPGAGDFGGERKRVEDSLYNRFAERMEPQLANARSLKDQELRNQGLMPGSKGYDDAMKLQSFAENDARSGARTDAVSMGLGEQQGLFDMGMRGRQQQVGERADLSRISGDERTQATQEYEASRYAPGTGMGLFQNATRGFMAPPATPMTAVDVGNVDVGGTSIGFKSLDKPYPAMVAPAVSGGGTQSPYASRYGSLASGSPFARQNIPTQGAGGGGGGGSAVTNSVVNGFSQGVTAGVMNGFGTKAGQISGNNWNRRAY